MGGTPITVHVSVHWAEKVVATFVVQLRQRCGGRAALNVQDFLPKWNVWSVPKYQIQVTGTENFVNLCNTDLTQIVVAFPLSIPFSSDSLQLKSVLYFFSRTSTGPSFLPARGGI